MMCFLVWSWFSTSGIDYVEGSPTWGRKTAGMFVLGMPVLIGFGFLVSACIAYVARRMGPAFAWPLTALVFGMLIYFSAVSSSPWNRLAAILNVDLQNVRICRLKQMDSFGDGITTLALIDGGDELFDRLCLANELRESSDLTPNFFNWLYDDETPFLEPVTLFENERLTCYNDTANNRLYIYHRSRSYPGED